MSEAKSSKLREYFTNTTHHTETKPTDLSGARLIPLQYQRSKSAQKSPIRLNDTHRSNVVLGTDESSIFDVKNLKNETPVSRSKQQGEGKRGSIIVD